MRSPEGKDYWSTGVYREIVPNERLVTTDSFADADTETLYQPRNTGWRESGRTNC